MLLEISCVSLSRKVKADAIVAGHGESVPLSEVQTETSLSESNAKRACVAEDSAPVQNQTDSICPDEMAVDQDLEL